MGELGWYDDVEASRTGERSRLLTAARSAFRPANLLPALLILLGWLAFIGWTGAGADGWQARVCADLAVQARSCGMVQAEDTSPASTLRTAS